MDRYFAEFVGTAILILLGNGVVANVLLSRTKGSGSGWMVICAGWGLAVFVAVLCVGQFSGAHINPAVTIGVAIAGTGVSPFPWADVPGYIAAQMAGALIGSGIVYLFYKSHYDQTQDADLKLATFCTAPAIRSLKWNFLCEAIATFVLVYAVLLSADAGFTLGEGANAQEVRVGLGSVGALPVGLVVFAIGLSLGGTTGYAINPARDLGPRIAHAILPIADKRDSDWQYAAIPVLGPISGGILAAILFKLQS